MHDNSQVIAFLNVGVLPSCKLYSVAIECPPDVCILCFVFWLYYPEERRGARLWPSVATPGCGPRQLILQPVTSEKPHRCSTGDI